VPLALLLVAGALQAVAIKLVASRAHRLTP
jgi:hypothetical protein